MKNIIQYREKLNTEGVTLSVLQHEDKRMTLLNSISLFSNNLIVRGLTESTSVAYTSDIKAFYNFIKRTFSNRSYVDTITRSDINHFQNYILSLDYKSNTIDRKFDSLSVYFQFLTDFGYIDKNPLENFVFNRSKNCWDADEDNYPNFLEMDEIEQIVEAARNTKNDRTTRDIAILELLKNTGCRRDTVLGLNWSDINFTKNDITLKHKKTKTKTIVQMSKSLRAAMIQLYNTSENPAGAVFISQKGNRLAKDAFSKLIRKYAVLSGVQEYREFDITSVTFRHSFITYLVKNNVSFEKIAQFTGHKQLETLRIYTHLVSTDTSDVINLLN